MASTQVRAHLHLDGHSSCLLLLGLLLLRSSVLPRSVSASQALNADRCLVLFAESDMCWRRQKEPQMDRCTGARKKLPDNGAAGQWGCGAMGLQGNGAAGSRNRAQDASAVGCSSSQPARPWSTPRSLTWPSARVATTSSAVHPAMCCTAWRLGWGRRAWGPHTYSSLWVESSAQWAPTQAIIVIEVPESEGTSEGTIRKRCGMSSSSCWGVAVQKSWPHQNTCTSPGGFRTFNHTCSPRHNRFP